MGWNLFLLCVLLVGSIEAASLSDEGERGYVDGDPTSSAAFQYMKTLYEQLEDDVAGVKCYADSDILAGNYRETPQSDVKCTTLAHYQFSVHSLPNVEDIKKAVLRAYLQVPPNTAFGDSNSIEAEIVVTMRLHNAETNATTEFEQVGAYEMTLTEESGDWMEMDVTHGIQNPEHSQFQVGAGTQVEFVLGVRTDCHGERIKGNLAYFVDPAAYRSTAARTHYSNLQPLLIIYSKQEQPLLEFLPEVENNDPPITRRSRHSRTYPPVENLCERHSFVIDFQEDLGWEFIIYPETLDIGICSGYCFHQSRYSYILSMVQQNRQYGSGRSVDELINNREPQCWPTEYHSTYVIVVYPDRELPAIVTLSGVVVSQCDCSCHLDTYWKRK